MRGLRVRIVFKIFPFVEEKNRKKTEKKINDEHKFAKPF